MSLKAKRNSYKTVAHIISEEPTSETREREDRDDVLAEIETKHEIDKLFCIRQASTADFNKLIEKQRDSTFLDRLQLKITPKNNSRPTIMIPKGRVTFKP